MTVAGLRFDDPYGPEGHSDGDVVAHAACDALLVAAGPGRPRLQLRHERSPSGAASAGSRSWSRPARRLRAAGWEPGNVAVQLVGNRPKLGPRRAEAEAVLSAAVGAPVTLSATTTDGLGLTGRGEGIAAIATACSRVSAR